MTDIEVVSEAREPTPVLFDGVTYHVTLSLLDLRDHRELFDRRINSAAGMIALLDLFEVMLGEEYEAFAAHVRRKRIKPSALLRLFEQVMDAEFFDDEVPTQPPTAPDSGAGGGSANGRSATGATSGVGSSLDLTGLAIMVEHRLSELEPERAQELRDAVAKVQDALAGPTPG